VGKGGMELPDPGRISRLFPRFPGFSHLFPLNFFTGQAQLGSPPGRAMGSRLRGTRPVGRCGMLRHVWFPKPATRWVPQWGCSLARNVVAMFHESQRKFAKVRTDQGRKSSIVRIFTGETKRSWEPRWGVWESWRNGLQTGWVEGCGQSVTKGAGRTRFNPLKRVETRICPHNFSAGRKPGRRAGGRRSKEGGAHEGGPALPTRTFFADG